MDWIVKTIGLSKTYRDTLALDGVGLNIEKGKVVGIVGPNGSGKTTLIKILAGVLRPSEGEAYIDGHSIGIHTKAVVSYLPDRHCLYDWMKISDTLNFYQDFYRDFDREKAEELLTFMKLEKNMKVSALSKGMKEKLSLTLVLARRAKLYILDEPIAGVDPVARDQILNAIIDNYMNTSAMLITTQLISDMENIFDDVVFLQEGKIVLAGNAEELREEKSMQINDLYKEIFG